MNLQINRLDTLIESMQEMFSKDLKEIKNNWPVINNTITEIKNTLEETNSTVTETEEKINVLEDKMVEINEAEWKKEKKNMKKWGQLQRPLKQC